MSRRRAFTLIEVMLCVGIIAVLAGIVFAALGPVRERARVTTCTSNLHQIWAAYAMYAADHDGAEPTTGVRARYYELGLPSDEQDHYLFDTYLKSRDVLFCPSYHGEKPTDHMGSTYLIFSRDKDRWADLVAQRGPDLPFYACQWHNPSRYPWSDVSVAPHWTVWNFLLLRLGGQVKMLRVNGHDEKRWPNW